MRAHGTRAKYVHDRPEAQAHAQRRRRHGGRLVTALTCPRCAAHVAEDVVTVTDTAAGLHVVLAAPVAAHQHLCGGGATFHITSTQPAEIHPGQLRLIRGAA